MQRGCYTVCTMPLVLYNSLTKQEEEFKPLDPDGREVTYYSCGPTVYDYAHIGNFRSFLNADVMRRTLELLGYEVKHVMNMTDVGHMTDDDVADGGGEPHVDKGCTDRVVSHALSHADVARRKEIRDEPARDVVIDRCPDCFGFWLDAGELESIQSLAGRLDSEILSKMTAVPQPDEARGRLLGAFLFLGRRS